jgi:rhodanese-related sulfurtransferase
MTALTEAPAPPIPEISRDELSRRLGDGALAIVDVLPAASYASAHLPGALSLPLADVGTRARRLLPDLHQEIAVYCGGPT